MPKTKTIVGMKCVITAVGVKTSKYIHINMTVRILFCSLCNETYSLNLSAKQNKININFLVQYSAMCIVN